MRQSLDRNHAFRPTWEIGASIAVHLLVVGVFAAGQMFGSSEPLFNPDDVMIVQAVALPKANTRMPDRPTRAPDPPKGDKVTAKAKPPPPTASDMALRKKKAAPKKAAAKSDTKSEAKPKAKAKAAAKKKTEE